jgi:hypothetical protein
MAMLRHDLAGDGTIPPTRLAHRGIRSIIDYHAKYMVDMVLVLSWASRAIGPIVSTRIMAARTR